jgi:hypothetical protein
LGVRSIYWKCAAECQVAQAFSIGTSQVCMNNYTQKLSNVTPLATTVHSMEMGYMDDIQLHAATLTCILTIYLNCDIKEYDNQML